MSSFFRARTIRILLQSLSATALAASQPSCDGSMWIRNGHFADDGIGGGGDIGVWFTGGKALANFISEARS